MISNGTAAAGLRAANNYFSGGVATITPASALRPISTPMVLDAQKQPGWTAARSSSSMGSVRERRHYGLNVTGGTSTIRGLVINNFDLCGCEFDAGTATSSLGYYLGTNAAGRAEAAAPMWDGVCVGEASALRTTSLVDRPGRPQRHLGNSGARLDHLICRRIRLFWQLHRRQRHGHRPRSATASTASIFAGSRQHRIGADLISAGNASERLFGGSTRPRAPRTTTIAGKPDRRSTRLAGRRRESSERSRIGATRSAGPTGGRREPDRLHGNEGVIVAAERGTRSWATPSPATPTRASTSATTASP